MLYESPLITAYSVGVTLVLGLCMGSFLNCLAWRLVNGESVLKGRSHCTSCGHVLAAVDLVPVFSWLSTHGRCRYCGDRVSVRYPATEILCATVYVSLLLRYGLTLETVELIAFSSILLVLSLTDLETYVIPNITIVAAIVVRLLYVVIGGIVGIHELAGTLIATLVGGFAVAVPVLLLALVMDRLLGRDSLGFGDVKLLFVAGMYFGWQQCLFLIIVACVIGIVFGALGSRHAQIGDDKSGEESGEEQGDDSQEQSDAEAHLIPFGPAIALACWITMLFAPQLLSWYFGLFGF